jgi:macrodomain Ter protein organizer (MatP/YcbG family)
MSRPKYTITAADVLHATFYLRPLLRSYAFDLRGDASYRTAEKEFMEVTEIPEKKDRAEALNAWCEKYIKAKTWNNLKTSIRKRRERKQRIRNKTSLKTISVSQKAFELLSKLATRDKVTHSETLEYYLGKAVRGKPRNW